MPLMTFHVVDEAGDRTGETFDHWFRKQSDVVDELTSNTGLRAVRGLSAIARTSTGWAGSAGTLWGVNGRWSMGVGARVNSHKELEAVAEAKGLINLSDLPKDFVETRMTEMDTRARELDKLAETTWS